MHKQFEINHTFYTRAFCQGAMYAIQSVNTEFPIAEAKFVRSYEHCGKTSHVFQYNVDFDSFHEWLKCWVHIAKNHTLVKGTTSEPYQIESHIFDDNIYDITIISNICPIIIEAGEYCGGDRIVVKNKLDNSTRTSNIM